MSLGGPNFYNVLTSIIAPTTETDASVKYDDLITKLTKHFSPKKNNCRMFHIFKRMQRHDEQLQEYIVELKQVS